MVAEMGIGYGTCLGSCLAMPSCSDWQNLLLTVVLLLVVYLLCGSTNFPHQWLWQKHACLQRSL